MAASKALVDSGFLFALYSDKDVKHSLAELVTETSGLQFIIPYVALTEAAFLFNRAGGVPAVIGFLDLLTAAKPLFEPVLLDDLARIREIMAFYTTARLDFVDCCIMALSERLNITRVCTFDTRDFTIFRPKHCDYLELLP